MRIGVISDTHGLLRPEALNALAGVDHILHAGDVGDPKILSALEAIAPLTAIRGNIDRSGPCAALPATEIVDLGGTTFYLLHDLHELDLDPMAAGISVVISGHSHKPLIERRRGVLYLNPGSAGPRRFSLPITIGLVTLGKGSPQAEIIPLVR
jgi:putative phosphoesterase